MVQTMPLVVATFRESKPPAIGMPIVRALAITSGVNPALRRPAAPPCAARA
jgi:hypothetical protein